MKYSIECSNVFKDLKSVDRICAREALLIIAVYEGIKVLHLRP